TVANGQLIYEARMRYLNRNLFSKISTSPARIPLLFRHAADDRSLAAPPALISRFLRGRLFHELRRQNHPARPRGSRSAPLSDRDIAVTSGCRETARRSAPRFAEPREHSRLLLVSAPPE